MSQNKNPQVFTPLLVAAGCFYAGLWLETHIVEQPVIAASALGLKLLAIYIGLLALGRLVPKLMDLVRYLRSRARSGLKGTAGWLTEAEAKAAKLHRRAKDSRILGVLGSTVIWGISETHQLIIGPAGSQKSSAGFFLMLCSIRASVLINDTKKELYEVTAKFRERVLGHTIVLLDPSDPETACINPLDILADLIARNLPEALTFVQAFSKQMKPDPPKPDQNAFFTIGSRMLLEGLCCIVAAVCPPNLRTLATVNSALADMDILHSLLERGLQTDALNGAVAEMASSIHSDAFGEDTRTFESVRKGAIQVTQIYTKGGPLEHITSKTTFDFADLKRKEVSVYIVVDFTNKDAAGPWAGMMQWLATYQLVRARSNKPVYLLLDEFCNAPLHGLPTMLTLLRSYGVRCIMATQDLDDIVSVYGKHALETVLSEADIKQFLGGIRSQTTLDYLTKYLGNQTVQAPSYSYQTDRVQESVNHTDRPVLTQDEIRRLDKRLQIVFYGNLRPMLLHKVQVFAIAPWRKRIGINSMYSTKRFLKPVEIRIGWFGAHVTRRGRMAKPARPSTWTLWVYLLRNFLPPLWITLLVAVLMATQGATLPHLRASYGYVGPYSARQFTWCRYIGPYPITMYGSNCPFILFRSKP